MVIPFSRISIKLISAIASIYTPQTALAGLTATLGYTRVTMIESMQQAPLKY